MQETDVRQLLIAVLNEHYPDDHISLDASMNVILAKSESMNLSLGLFLDEAQERYNHKSDWNSLHSCVTSWNTAVFLSGSDAFLAPRVKLNVEDRIYLKSIGDTQEHVSLNNTKFSQFTLTGLNSMDQYINYFIGQPSHFQAIFRNLLERWELDGIALDDLSIKLKEIYYTNNDTSKDLEEKSKLLKQEIQQLHSITGGRIRTILLKYGAIHAIFQELLITIQLIFRAIKHL